VEIPVSVVIYIYIPIKIRCSCNCNSISFLLVAIKSTSWVSTIAIYTVSFSGFVQVRNRPKVHQKQTEHTLWTVSDLRFIYRKGPGSSNLCQRIDNMPTAFSSKLNHFFDVQRSWLSSTGQYVVFFNHLGFNFGTNNSLEHFFSQCTHGVMGDRSSMSPFMFEVINFLENNSDLWGMREMAKAVYIDINENYCYMRDYPDEVEDKN
jgi:hypothetical protein